MALLLEIKSINSSDEYPADPEDAFVSVQADIGVRGQDGADEFQFVVATPKALLKLGLPTWGKGLLIVERFDWRDIRKALDELLTRCSGMDWVQVSAKLNRELWWEYEDYKP